MIEPVQDVVGPNFRWVPKIGVAGAALEKNQDDVFCGAPARAAGALAGFAGEGLQFEERAKGEAKDARAADAEQIATGHFEVRIAKIAAGAAGYFDHKNVPWLEVKFDWRTKKTRPVRAPGLHGASGLHTRPMGASGLKEGFLDCVMA